MEQGFVNRLRGRVPARVLAGALTTIALVNAGCGGSGDKDTFKVDGRLVVASGIPGDTAPEPDIPANHDIYAQDTETGRMANLTPGKGDDLNPQISPDNKRIAYYSNRDTRGTKGINQIYTFDLGKKLVARLTSGGLHKYDPTYLPDNRIVYKVDPPGKADAGDLWLMNDDGSRQKNVTPIEPASLGKTEQWKPTAIDNRHIGFTNRSTDEMSDDLYVEDVNTRKAVRLTRNFKPDWFSDICPKTGDTVFTSTQPNGDSDAIYVSKQTSDVISDRQLLVGRNTLEGDNSDPSWSPNCKQVVFLNNSSGRYTTHVIEVATGKHQEIHRPPEGEEDLGPILVGATG